MTGASWKGWSLKKNFCLHYNRKLDFFVKGRIQFLAETPKVTKEWYDRQINQLSFQNSIMHHFDSALHLEGGCGNKEQTPTPTPSRVRGWNIRLYIVVQVSVSQWESPLKMPIRIERTDIRQYRSCLKWTDTSVNDRISLFNGVLHSTTGLSYFFISYTMAVYDILFDRCLWRYKVGILCRLGIDKRERPLILRAISLHIVRVILTVTTAHVH